MPKDNIEKTHQEGHLFLRFKSVDSQKPNRIWATASTTDSDRQGEVVEPFAFKSAWPSFIANPVVLPCHLGRLDNGKPPVIATVATDEVVFGENEVLMPVDFDDDELGSAYLAKYKKGIMRAFSIGFMGIKGEFKNIDGKNIWYWLEIELLELSCVAVPANRRALARVKGFYDRDDDESIAEKVVEGIKNYFEKNPSVSSVPAVLLRKSEAAGTVFSVAELKTFIEDKFDEIKSLLIPGSGEFAEDLLGGPSGSDSPAGEKIAGYVERIEKACQSLNKGDNQ